MTTGLLILSTLLFITSSGLIEAKFIIGGEQAKEDEIQYQAYLTIGKYHCGGALIHPNWVLTAAHCLKGEHAATVMLGSVHTNYMTYQETSKQLFLHPDFNTTTKANDIGLIRLPKSTAGVRNIAVVPLGSISDKTNGQTVRISGFGRTEEDKKSDFLMKLDMHTVPNDVCRTYYQDKYIQNTSLCTTWIKTAGESACHGDSGGPVTLEKNAKHVLVAIVSGGKCKKNYPTVSTRVGPYKDWIHQTMNGDQTVVSGCLTVHGGSFLLVISVILSLTWLN